MATQQADCGPHPDFRSAKFGPPHYLEFISWGCEKRLLKVEVQFIESED